MFDKNLDNELLGLNSDKPAGQWSLTSAIREAFDAMLVVDSCECGWTPDCEDSIIAYGKKEYSAHLSMLSAFSQHTWCEIHRCPECNSDFKTEAESC